jgi:pimeloyl-ACP methyl ester carboxylesterase
VPFAYTIAVMRKLGRWLFRVLAVLALLVALGIRRDRPAAEVEARYATPPSRFLAVDGMRVHYRDRGAGPPIVLLHGSNSSLFTWEGWAAALSPEHRVITLDLPGHGLTGPDPQARYSLAEMAELVDHFAAALELDRFSLAGNSMGGGVALHYALAHPDKLDRLILVDAYAYPQTPPPMLRLFTLPIVGQLTRWITPRFLVAGTVRQVYGDPSRVTDADIERYYELLLREGNRQATRLRLSNRRDDSLTARLKDIKTPTLILWGSLDRWILPRNGERLAHDIPGAKLVVLDRLGHVPMEEDPARSVAPVIAFLR